MSHGDAPVKKVVLAYSGGLDTSVILKWMRETLGYQVIAFCADLGQGEDMRAVKAKAMKMGASKVYIEDLRETFVRDYIFPMLRANAVYEGTYLLGTSIARPWCVTKILALFRCESVCLASSAATRSRCRLVGNSRGSSPNSFMKASAAISTSRMSQSCPPSRTSTSMLCGRIKRWQS